MYYSHVLCESRGMTVENAKRFNITPLIMVLIMAFSYLLLYDLTAVTDYAGGGSQGTSILDHCMWDSYTLQALAWKEGRLYIAEAEYNEAGERTNYAYLELAEYDNKLYVSFPPFPSVVMLPFTYIFGSKTPNQVIIAAICIITALIAYKILKKLNTDDKAAAFIAIAYVFGSNMLTMSLNGGVWFMAQAINLLLCTWAIYAMITNRRILSYALIAFAVGCRPFSILFFIVLFAVYLIEDIKADSKSDIFINALKQWKCLIIPLVIALCYMSYNYARFDNALEFGHNYLEEFRKSPNGQFSLVYLGENLSRLLFGKIALNSRLHLEYTWFDGFMFYIANPFFLVMFIQMIRNAFKRSFSVQRLVIIFAFVMNILLLCCHKTLGGWQFGARYTVDMLPYALLYMLIQTPEKGLSIDLECKAWKLKKYEFVILLFAVMFNAYGAVKFWVAYYN